jgi:hypothetical protein
MVNQEVIKEKKQLYMITEKQRKAINVLMRVVNEAVIRAAFDENEIQKIQKTIDQLVRFDD